MAVDLREARCHNVGCGVEPVPGAVDLLPAGLQGAGGVGIVPIFSVGDSAGAHPGALGVKEVGDAVYLAESGERDAVLAKVVPGATVKNPTRAEPLVVFVVGPASLGLVPAVLVALGSYRSGGYPCCRYRPAWPGRERVVPRPVRP